MAWRVGVDSGGTFTDICLFDEQTGRVEIWKVSSTPDDPSRGIAQGVAEGIARVGSAPGAIGYFGHGTTVGTNALIQHKRRAHRPDHHRRLPRPAGDRPPEAPRPLRPASRQAAPPWCRATCAWKCRNACATTARSKSPLDEAALRAAVRQLRDAGVQAIAVCFLYGFVNTAHEETASRILARRIPRRLRLHQPRRRAGVPRVRAHVHRRGERLSRPRHAPLHHAAGRAAGNAGHARAAASDAVQRRRHRLRAGGAPAGAHRAVRPLHRRRRRAGDRRAGRPARPHHLRHGRHQHRCRAARRAANAGWRARRRCTAIRSRRRCSTSTPSAPAAARSPSSTAAAC